MLNRLKVTDSGTLVKRRKAFDARPLAPDPVSLTPFMGKG
jgi:hypothetical protein